MKDCIEKLTEAEETSASIVEELYAAMKCCNNAGVPLFLGYELRGLKASAEQLLFEIGDLKKRVQKETTRSVGKKKT